jgi:hypothetical protein
MARCSIIAMVDDHGRIVAAQLNDGTRSKDKDQPSEFRIMPSSGQREVRFDVPEEVLQLSGTSLHRFFSNVKVSGDGKAQVPKFRVERLAH